jgi:hypothetical protein
MRLHAQGKQSFLRGTVALAILVGLGACGPDYALFKLIMSDSPSTAGNSNSPDTALATCRLTVNDSSGKAILNNYQIDTCASFRTDLGVLSYSSDRTSGYLTFVLTGYDNKGKPVSTPATSKVASKPFHVASDEISVNLVIP